VATGSPAAIPLQLVGTYELPNAAVVGHRLRIMSAHACGSPPSHCLPIRGQQAPDQCPAGIRIKHRRHQRVTRLAVQVGGNGICLVVVINVGATGGNDTGIVVAGHAGGLPAGSHVEDKVGSLQGFKLRIKEKSQ